MNKDTMWEAMEHLSPELIEDADQRQRRRLSAGRVLVIAAAACLVLAAGVLGAESIFGFRLIDLRNDETDNGYGLIAEETTKFPISQFGETVQDYIQNGMPILEQSPTESSGTGEIEAYTVVYDIPTFSTWDEAAEFVGADIPLVAENSVLAEGTHQDFTIHAADNCVLLQTAYTLEGNTILFTASAAVEGGQGYTTGASLGDGEMTTTPRHAATGSGADVLLYVTTGIRPSCDAYFIQDGIFYSIFLASGDLALMEEILAAF